MSELIPKNQNDHCQIATQNLDDFQRLTLVTLFRAFWKISIQVLILVLWI